MSKGFVTLGIDTDEDRIFYSHALAMSLKNSSPDSEICLIVDKGKSDFVLKQYPDAFDYITELPFGNTGHKDGYHGSNVWQAFYATPFEETIYVDSDTLFLNVNIDDLWDTFSSYDMAFPSIANSYRNVKCRKDRLFDIETHYNFPQLYSSLCYFKRSSPLAIEWFKMADPLYQNWKDLYQKLFNEKRPPTFNKTVVANSVTQLLDVEKEVSAKIDNFYDLHSYGQYLWHYDIPENWTHMLNYWYTDHNELIVENSSIKSGIIHYRDEEFLTEEVYDVIRRQFKAREARKIIE
jgi:hypothetical protein